MIRILLLTLVLFPCIRASAQPLTAYYDFQNRFFVWDNGMTRKVDYLIPQEYKIGRSAVPFIDNARNFQIYYNGATTKINDGFTNYFEVSDNLVAFLNARVLYVYDQGTITKLSNFCSDFYVGDSVVMYYDKIQSEFNIYYNNQIYNLENFLSGSTVETIFRDQASKVLTDNQDLAYGQMSAAKVSDNIAAYVNYANRFKVFYQGELIEVDQYLIKNFGVGRNTAAFVNMNQQFLVFHKGNIIDLEAYQPYSYQVGDNLVAYLANDNNFKVFYDGEIYNLGYFQNDYTVVDNVVYFEDQTGYFNVFYKGETYRLESYIPETIIAGYNSVAYVSRGNIIKIFTEGETYDVVTAEIPEWSLDYDVIKYRFGANLNKVFYKGKTY